MSSLSNRLRQARKLRGLKQADLAHLVDSGPVVISQWETEAKKPSPRSVGALAQALGVRREWLETGEGPMQREGAAELAISYGTDGETVWMPVFAPKPSAGNGNHIHLEDSEESMPFSAPYLHSLGVSPREAFILKVDGDSMEPALRHGEHVMVDRSAAARGLAAGVWVFSVRGALSIKRLQALPSGQFRVLSDNPAYEPYTVDPAADPFQLIGRVVWAGRRF